MKITFEIEKLIPANPKEDADAYYDDAEAEIEIEDGYILLDVPEKRVRIHKSVFEKFLKWLTLSP